MVLVPRPRLLQLLAMPTPLWYIKNNAVGQLLLFIIIIPSFIGFYAGIVAFSAVFSATKRFYTNNGFQYTKHD